MTTPTRDQLIAILYSNLKPFTGHASVTMETRLTHIGLDSFQILQLSNQITEELEQLAYPTSSLDGLLEKLLDKTLGKVVDYLELRFCLPESVQVFSFSSRKRPLATADCVESTGEDKRMKQDSGSGLVPGDGGVASCDGHVIGIVVESRRRGQYFINSR